MLCSLCYDLKTLPYEKCFKSSGNTQNDTALYSLSQSLSNISAERGTSSMPDFQDFFIYFHTGHWEVLGHSYLN